MKNKIGKGLCAVVILIVLAAVIKYGGEGFAKLEHYNRVHQNPMKVTALVTKHGEDSGAENTNYWAAAKYEVDGKTYTLRFEYKSAKADLTPIGEEVTVEVSPEDPSVQVFRLASEGAPACVTSVLCGAALLSICWSGVFRGCRTKGGNVPSRETARKDLSLTVVANPGLAATFLIALGCFAMHLRYGAAFKAAMAVVAGISAMLWVAVLIGTIAVLRKINRGEYTLRKDILVEKKIDLSGDSTSYELYYVSEDGSRQWKASTDAEEYTHAKEGDVIMSVSLNGWKKPLIRYNKGGAAG